MCVVFILYSFALLTCLLVFSDQGSNPVLAVGRLFLIYLACCVQLLVHILFSIWRNFMRLSLGLILFFYIRKCMYRVWNMTIIFQLFVVFQLLSFQFDKGFSNMKFPWSSELLCFYFFKTFGYSKEMRKCQNFENRNQNRYTKYTQTSSLAKKIFQRVSEYLLNVFFENELQRVNSKWFTKLCALYGHFNSSIIEMVKEECTIESAD